MLRFISSLRYVAHVNPCCAFFSSRKIGNQQLLLYSKLEKKPRQTFHELRDVGLNRRIIYCTMADSLKQALPKIATGVMEREWFGLQKTSRERMNRNPRLSARKLAKQTVISATYLPKGNEGRPQTSALQDPKGSQADAPLPAKQAYEIQAAP